MRRPMRYSPLTGFTISGGRKDPFIGPSTYRADNGSSASMYNAKSGTVKLESVESDAETGTADYAVQHPLEYITGTRIRITIGPGAMTAPCGAKAKR